MEGLTLGVTDGSVETDEKALLWIFGENLRLPESERWLTEPCRVLEAF